MKKEELIALHGQEWYEKRLECSRKYRHSEKGKAKQRELTKKWHKEHPEYGRNKMNKWMKDNREKYNASRREYWKARGDYMSPEQRCSYVKDYVKGKKDDPIFMYRFYLAHRRKILGTSSTPEQAIELLKKEATEEHCIELLDTEYAYERFKNNCKYGLVYGNIRILKFFYKLMQIKVATEQEFTEHEKEMIKHFRTCDFGKVNYQITYLKNNWFFDLANIDMVYIEDMIRNLKGKECLVSEEKYLEMKALTTEE